MMPFEGEASNMLCEFHLATNELDRQTRINIILDIYREILYRDNLWHFFYEEEVGDIVRCSSSHAPALNKFLEGNNIEYTWSDKWYESIPDVIDNRELFAHLFHLASMHVVDSVKKGANPFFTITSLVDRFSHALYINSTLAVGPSKHPEGTLLSTVALGRAFYDGRRQQYLLQKGYEKENGK